MSEQRRRGPGVYSGGDRHWIDVLDVIATDRGYFLRPDYEPKRSPYRTVMTYTKMMTKHDSITFLLAQDRSTKKYFVIVWDLPTQRGWSSEAIQVKTAIGDQIGQDNVRLTKPWMERYSSNQPLQPTALWRCASMSIFISMVSTVAQPRSQSGG
jgi:hypothetical protein